jgi:HD-like signal output (HDOD) protein
VLGFEMVMNLALGIATARSFKIPSIGPLGLNAFWRHATYSATLVQALSRELPPSSRPLAGLSYLAGLLHNFGHLLLGHLFKREYCILSNLVSDHPEVPLIEHERAALGIEHGELGGWLLEQWNMPEEIIVAVREHHREDYDGPHAVYSRLVLIADRMLRDLDMGDATTNDLPAPLLDALGLKEIQTVMVMGRILEGMTDLNAMARALAAA